MTGDATARALNLPVLVGSVREGRRSIHVARHVGDALARREGIEAGLIDLSEFDLPILIERPQQADRPPPGYEPFQSRLRAADGLVIVSPEYKGGIPGVLKNALDHLEPGVFRRRPIGIVTVSAGGLGGVGCLAQLRQVCLSMGGLPIPVALPVSEVEALFDERGDAVDDRLARRLGPFLDELIWYVGATARQRRLDAASGGA
ncbi:FMN-dependent NADPH-azoreductase [Aquisphaera giovannonii]|uniref:FMN-dependent NADPH-azoreductase n=1 Tax=Aquisphaera giovannonii TaxID=406548 RepID=A0A5B9WER9_9BACT|nr:NAD(P)H-dependent oxidoreductase [Aquisphaera giovannonii]QEH38545.1 FMN-dependent NADPH-azoreductase [Aquisphaera giovannonii]